MTRATLAFTPRSATVLFALAGSCVTGCADLSDNLLAARSSVTYDAETLFNNVTVFGSSFSHDETRLLLTSDETGVFNVYEQPLDGGAKTQLTHSKTDPVYGVSWFPEDDRLLFQRDRGGNERTHLFVREKDGAEIELTPGEETRATFFGWSGDFRSFFALSNARDPQFMDLYRFSVPPAAANGRSGGYEDTLLYKNEGGLMPRALSRDGRWLVCARAETNANDDLLLIDLSDPGSARRLITPHEGDVSHDVFGFSPDSAILYYGSNDGSEFNRVFSYDVATHASALAHEASWDVTSYDHSYRGRYLAISVNADASTELTVLDTATGDALELPRIPAGDVTSVSFSRSESKLAFGVNGDTAPTNLFSLDLRTQRLTQLTDTLNRDVNPSDLVESEVIRYPSFDGLLIPSILYKPKSADTDNRMPGIVFVHGGPGGQTRKGYRAEIQYLVNHGYAVLGVNNRGSSGYGKTFNHLDDRRHGEDDLQDCIAGRRYLESLEWIDPDRIAIMGGSYGGYMVAAALTLQPEAFDVGIDIFGVTNWIRTLESIPAWWSAQRKSLYAELGDPAIDRDRLMRISPLFHGDQIVRPLLVVQGANDPRVLQVESDELVAAARKNGVPVEYIVFQDEGHGFRSRENRITAAEAYVEFLNTYLTGQEATHP